MTKRRVHDLAKDYGMKGPDFVRVLHELGFEAVKTHMTLLDDADLMVIEVRLGAAGYRKSAAQAGGGTAVKRKTPILKKKAEPSATAEIAEPPAAPPPAGHGEPSGPRKVPVRRKARADEAGSEAPAAAESTPPPPAVAEPIPHPETIESPPEAAEPLPHPEVEPYVEPEPEPVAEAAVEAPPPPAVEIEIPSEPELAPEPEVEQPLAPPPDAEPPSERTVERPAATLTPISRRAPREEERREPAPEEPVAPGPAIRRLPQPERRAKILGRIELPQETINDATRRSAPAGPRNPAAVDRNLRQAALQQFRQRGAQKTPVRRAPTTGRPAAGGRAGGRRGKADLLATPPGIDPEKVVQVEAPVSVKKLSEALGHKVSQLLVVLLRLGVTANINSYLDKDQVELVALELGRNVEVVEAIEAEAELISSLQEAKDAQDKETEEGTAATRPPIVTFMGHVDHGKTTLLDALRGSTVASGEAGGITQHIGAYKIERSGRQVVVLDTPGHAAFTAMRARGAQLTDVVVLVVAADDGVKPQTEEALNHARAADVPIVVAVTKVDKSEANPMRPRQQLATLGLAPEEWGGKTQFVNVSSTKGTGLDELVEKIGLEADLLELQAAPDHPATGVVIEAKQTPAQGNVISLMVLDGTLRRGDIVLCGPGTGRVRVLLDDHGQQIEEAPPGTPVEVLGLPELPSPGDKFHVVTDPKQAREVAAQRATKQRSLALAEKSKARLMDLKSQLAAAKVREVRLIIKADVMGSLEPIRRSLEELSNEEVAIRILHAGLGGITETDVALADASDALIVGFNSVPDEKARSKAEEAGVTIRFYNIIYELIDDAKKLLEGLLSPEQKEEVRGHAAVRAVFKSSKYGNIAGCFVTDGVIARNHKVRLVRDGTVVYSGKIASLRREKDDAREVKSNLECGILLHNYSDLKEGDVIETYEVVELQRTLGD